MIRVRELLAAQDLGLTVRAWGDGLDAWIRWAHIADEVGVVSHLKGGEMVLTNVTWGRRPGGDEAYVCAIAARGVVALGTSGGSEGRISRRMVEACQRLGVVLLEIPPEVSCEEVVEQAIALIVERGRPGVARALQREQALTRAISGGGGVRKVLELLARECKRPVWLVTGGATVEPLGQAAAPLAEVSAVLDQRHAHRDGASVMRPNGAEMCCFPVETGNGGGRTDVRLVCECPPGEMTSEKRIAVEQARRFVGVAIAAAGQRREARRQACNEFMARFTSGRASAEELAVWSRALGIEVRGHVVCLVARVAQGGIAEVQAVAEALEDVADVLDLPRVVMASGQEACAFLFAGTTHDARVEEAVTRAQLVIGAAFRRCAIAVGSASVIARETTDLARALLDARQVSRLNTLHEPEAGEPAGGSEQALSVWLLGEDELRRGGLVKVMLEPLLAYDDAHHSDLVGTLGCFLGASGQWGVAASQLGVHVNTLRYRLAKIEKLTGRDLGAMATRVDFYVALRAREMGAGGVGGVRAADSMEAGGRGSEAREGAVG